MGCALTVTIDGGKITVAGNGCPRGAVYGEKEVTHPTRTVTSTVRVEGGEINRLSVKTESDIPKESIFAVMEEIKNKTVKAPVTLGETVIGNAAGTGVDVIATKTVERKNAK